jgi:YfiH family protein
MASDASTTCTLIRPEIFGPDARVVGGFSTRHGGISRRPFATLNVAVSTLDDPENVNENRRRVIRSTEIPEAAMALPLQVHGAGVQTVDRGGLVRDCDGLVTSTARLLLGVTVADCAAVLLADPLHRVAAACHAGWRGCLAGIVPATCRAMIEQGAKPEAILAYVGPCISVERFEVGPEVAGRFPSEFVHRRKGAKHHVDLRGALRQQLLSVGLPERHIEVSTICNASNTDDFFSHRAENGKTGRMMGLVALV